MPFMVASTLASQPDGSYVRQAFLNGLRMQAEDGVNPYKFGESSDTHNATYAGDSIIGVRLAEIRKSCAVQFGTRILPAISMLIPHLERRGPDRVWAHPRDYDGFRRKETDPYEGSGGYDLPATEDPDVLAKSYSGGVSMGGDLIGESRFYRLGS